MSRVYFGLLRVFVLVNWTLDVPTKKPVSVMTKHLIAEQLESCALPLESVDSIQRLDEVKSITCF